MKCLILAAGYATRLYPLTENFPKPLLKVSGKTILDHLVDDIERSGEIDEYVVISNHKFAEHFYAWAKEKSERITVVDDGSTSNETRLGAVRDIRFAIEALSLDCDMLVIAGDNLLDFSLTEFIDYAKKKNASCTMRYYEKDEQRLRKSGVVSIDETDRIIKMTEKPSSPETHWCSPAFYYYTADDARRVGEALADGCGADAPGSFISWLSSKRDVYAMEMPGNRYDIGNIESYERACKEYKGICKSKTLI